MYRRRQNTNQRLKQKDKKKKQLNKASARKTISTPKVSKKKLREQKRKDEKRKILYPRSEVFSIFQKKEKLQKKEKNTKFSITPIFKISQKTLSRVANVKWGECKPMLYHFEHLNNDELWKFWQMNDDDKAIYLQKHFDVHHRKPQCQNGSNNTSNLSHVDRASHIEYNGMISVIAKWAGIDITQVLTKHIAAFLWHCYPSLEKMFTPKDRSGIKSLAEILLKKNIDTLSRKFVVRVVSLWVGAESGSVKLINIRNFLSHIYPSINRLAYDHEAGCLRSLGGLAQILNEIWLPVSEQIVFKSRS
jgi:hypothetical protein